MIRILLTIQFVFIAVYAIANNNFPIENLTFYGDAYQATNNNQITLNGTGAWLTSYSNEAFELPIHLEFTSTNTARTIIGLQPVGGQETLIGWSDSAYKVYFNSAGALSGKLPNVWDVSNLAYTPNELVEIDIDVLGNLVVKSGGTIIHTGQAPISNYQLTLSALQDGSIDNIQLSANQVLVLSEFPENLQFYGRDLQTNKATIPIVGEVPTIGDSVSVVILRNGQPYSQQGIKPTSLEFELNPQIDAELAEYTVQLYMTASGNTTLYQQADSVVAGDVYIITGQSNAESKMFSGSAAENNSEFIRVYGLGSQSSATLTANLRWFIGQGDGTRDTQGNTGQWGLYVAKKIIDNQQIPVCIFNGARGGWAIINFIKDDADPENLETNYGRLLYRLNRTKLADKVRAVFWYQGERDANANTPPATYKEHFESLYDAWRTDCPSIEKIYITQVHHGCGTTTQMQSVLIQEAHRQLAEELPDTRIMSTKGLLHHSDVCHFPYEGGYKELGRRYHRLMEQDLYGESVHHAISPDIKSALFANNNEIIIETKQQDNLIWEAGTHTYFQLEGSTANVIDGYTLGNYVVLQLDADGSDATGLTFFDLKGIISPYVINEDGHGLVSFHNFPISDNSAPIAIDDSFSMNENTVLSASVSPNDSDPDADNLAWSVTPSTPPTNGTLNILPDGTFTYTPNIGFYGVDNFTYQVCDDYMPITTYTGQVNSGADDVEQQANNGSINVNSGDLDIMEDATIMSATGIRITNINIPQNAIITDAYLEFVADESNMEATSLSISAEDIGNAAPIPTSTNALTTKTKTTAINWSDIPAWIAGNTYASSDISPVVQSIINRSDWQSGNAMTFIIEGTGIRTAESYDGDPALAPKLKINYKTLDNPLSIQRCDEATVNIEVVQTCMELNISAFLEGAYDATSNEMTTELSSTRRLLPGQTPTSNLATPTPAGQPYYTAPWNYAGTEGATWTDSNYTGNETDWILVSFRTGTAKNTEVAMTAGLLMKDGSITFPDRCALLSTVASPLYIVVEHRNHIGIMSENPVSIVGNILSYDFRLANSFNNSTGFGQKQLPTGEWVMYAGDADQSDFPSYDITGSDKNIWTQNNGIFDYYFSPDFNLDGDINGQDKNIWERNNGISSRVPK